MRLSSVLSDYTSNTPTKIDSFINKDKYIDINDDVSEDDIKDREVLSCGNFIELDIGSIILNFFCKKKNDNISFTSQSRSPSFAVENKLHCLVITNQLISMDCVLKCFDYDDNCRDCSSVLQVWFLIKADDIFSNSPTVNILSYNFKLPTPVNFIYKNEDDFSELLHKAEIAYNEGLGAGSIVYLRTIFEKITYQVGIDANANIYKPNGKFKPFEQVLEAVDKQCSIIPMEYSANGYQLFRKLSEIIHGRGRHDEQSTLEQYTALKCLVEGILYKVEKQKTEIMSNEAIKSALDSIGFTDEN